MKELFQKMMKKLRKHSEAAGAIAALLLIVLFSGVMILGIRTQRESVPENPTNRFTNGRKFRKNKKRGD